jgi:hypothetical protein
MLGFIRKQCKKAGINFIEKRHFMWVPVITAWRVLGLWMVERASRFGG